MKYKYEVLFITYCEGIAEGDSRTFDKLSRAKKYAQTYKSQGLFYRSCDFILKYGVNPKTGGAIRYVKRVWLYKNGKWYATRKVNKYLHLMEL